jgi:Domain of unknown function (DUF892)
MATTNRIKTGRSKNGVVTAPSGIVSEVKRFFHLQSGNKITTLQQLFVEQLKDLYSAETQLIDALPKMAAAAHAAPLKQGFQTHLVETKEHARRLEKILKGLKQDPEGRQRNYF